MLAEALQVAAQPAAPPEPQVQFGTSPDAQPETLQALAEAQNESAATVAPEPRPAEIIMTAEAIAPAELPETAEAEVVTVCPRQAGGIGPSTLQL